MGNTNFTASLNHTADQSAR